MEIVRQSSPPSELDTSSGLRRDAFEEPARKRHQAFSRGKAKKFALLVFHRRHLLKLNRLPQVKQTALRRRRRYVQCKVGEGNCVYMSVQCLNKGSMKVDASCKANALKCGHAHTKVNLDRIGKFVTINCFTVHTSGYPRKVNAFVVQFFFSSSSDRPKRQLVTNSAAYLVGNFNPALTSSVGRRVVRDWRYLLCKHRRGGMYQGRSLKDVVEYSTSFIRSDLGREFPELQQLMRAAEHEYCRLHDLEVVTHTIWIIEKRSRAGGSGGFAPHIDQFEFEKRHIGTISTPVAFVRALDG
jgi:hypothetical protein